VLKVEKFGDVHITITDTENDEVIYDATNDVDCVIEALGFYFDEDVEFEDKEVQETIDPLKEYDTSSLSKDQEIELSDEPLDENGEDSKGDGGKHFVQIQINDGKDWPDDDYDENED